MFYQTTNNILSLPNKLFLPVSYINFSLNLAVVSAFDCYEKNCVVASVIVP